MKKRAKINLLLLKKEQEPHPVTNWGKTERDEYISEACDKE